MNGSFDIAIHREVEFYDRVNANDPANSAFILMVLSGTGLVADSVLRTYATFSDILAGASDEVTNTNYGRKTLTDADLAAYTVDTSAHRIELFLPTPQTFSSIAAGNSWRKLIAGYDSDTTGGGDASIVPVWHLDLLKDGVAVVPNGNHINIALPDGVFIGS